MDQTANIFVTKVLISLWFALLLFGIYRTYREHKKLWRLSTFSDLIEDLLQTLKVDTFKWFVFCSFVFSVYFGVCFIINFYKKKKNAHENHSKTHKIVRRGIHLSGVLKGSRFHAAARPKDFNTPRSELDQRSRLRNRDPQRRRRTEYY